VALAENALSTYERVRLALGLSVPTDDALAAEQLARVEFLINAASASIERFVNHPLAFKAGVVEDVAPKGTNRLFVRRTPVRAIHSITLLQYDRTPAIAFDPATYSCAGEDAEAGLITRNIQAFGGASVQGVGWTWAADMAPDIAGSFLAGSERRAIRIVYDGGWITPAQADTANGGQGGTADLPADIELACVWTAVGLQANYGNNPNVSSATLHQSSMSFDRGSPAAFIPAVAIGALNRYRRYAP